MDMNCSRESGNVRDVIGKAMRFNGIIMEDRHQITLDWVDWMSKRLKDHIQPSSLLSSHLHSSSTEADRTCFPYITYTRSSRDLADPRYNIPIPNPSTTPLSQLQATLSAQTSIPTTQLKLIHKGAVLKDNTLTLSSYGIVDGTQLVMIGKEGEIPSAPEPRQQIVKKKNKQPETDTESVLTDWIRSLVNSTLDPLGASIATFLSYTRQPKEGEEINRPKQIPKDDVLQREHARLSELLLRGLLDLDGVEIPSEWQTARKERKEGVRRVQGELNRVDEAWGEKKAAA